MIKGDIVEYCGRKAYISDVIGHQAIIVFIDSFFDGHKTYYSFDDIGSSIVIDLDRIKQGMIFCGDSGIIKHIEIKE